MAREGTPQDTARGAACGGTARDFTRREAALLFGSAGAVAALTALSGCASSSSADGSAPSPAGATTSSSSGQSYWLYNPAGVRENGVSVDSDLRHTMDAAGLDKPSRAAESSVRSEAFYPESDLYAEVYRLFLERGWGDGLPMVPPVEQNMIRMAKGTDLPRETVVATIPPLMGRATVEKVAANAVMAGCAPCHLPFVLAAAEAVADDAYDLVGSSTTTSPNATLVIANGPAALEAGMNCGSNALGRGCRANAAIGRAVHLVEQNVGGAWPGVSDYSTLGNPGEFAMALAENEEANPWGPLHVERGFAAERSVVTVASAESFQLVVDIDVDDRGFLDRVARTVCSRQRLNQDFLLILTPATADKLAKAGWDKESVLAYIRENTRVHISQLDQQLRDKLEAAGGSNGSSGSAGAGGSSDAGGAVEGVGEPDEDGMVQLSVARSLEVIVAGGVGEKNAVVPLWSPAVSREVALPANWDTLVEDVW